MQYKSPVITPPIKWGENYEVNVGGLGDSIFVTPIPQMDTTLKLPEIQPSGDRRKRVYIKEIGENIAGYTVEGNPLTVTVGITEISGVDVNVDVAITHDGLVEVQNEWRASKDATVADSTDYVSTFFVDAVDGDYDVVTKTITIPAGQLEASETFNTVDDATLQLGAGSFKVSKLTITAIDDLTYNISSDKATAILLIEDSSAFPYFKGEVEVWGKIGELSEFEPIMDVESSETLSITFDWNLLDDGVTVDSFAGKTQIIDDTPLNEIMFKFPTDSIPEDIDTVAPVDLTTLSTFVRFQVICGNR